MRADATSSGQEPAGSVRDQVNRLTPAARVLGTLISAVFGDRSGQVGRRPGTGAHPVGPTGIDDAEDPARAA